MAQYPNFSAMDDIDFLDKEPETFESDSDSDYEDASDEDAGECNLQYDEYGQLLKNNKPISDDKKPAATSSKQANASKSDVKRVVTTSNAESIPYTKIAWVTVKQGSTGKMGLTLRAVGKKIFLSYVEKGSEAAKAGLGFGDQVLAIQGVEDISRSGSEIMHWIKMQHLKQFTFKIHKRPFDVIVKGLRETTYEMGFYNKSEMLLGRFSISKIAHSGAIKKFRIIAVDDVCTVGYNEGELASALLKNRNDPKAIRLMPIDLYRQLVKRQSKERMKISMQLSPLK